MDSATAARLLKINRDFYDQFGDSFSATRQRIQPGVRRVLDMLNGDEAILDLGCGNGELARVLARRNHRGSYLGLDFSLPLLKNAESQPQAFPIKFLQADLTSDWDHVVAIPSLRVAREQSPHELGIASSAILRMLLAMTYLILSSASRPCITFPALNCA